MSKLKILITFTFLLLSSTGISQNCTNYHIDNCRWADRTFLYSRQSRSALFKPGMTSKFKIVVYGGEEYYISIDGHRKLGDIRLRILEENEKKTVLYDNAEFKYEKFFYFKNSLTKDLTIEVSTKENEKHKNKEFCVGVLIEFRDTGSSEDKNKKVGF